MWARALLALLRCYSKFGVALSRIEKPWLVFFIVVAFPAYHLGYAFAGINYNSRAESVGFSNVPS
jgi:hypothetical protein